MAKVAVVYHSGYGHTKLQAEAVYKGAASVNGVEAILYTSEEAIERLDELDSFDGIIFGAPTYMGSMSAEMKRFVEATSKKWFSMAWKDKIAGAFTNSASFSGDKLNTLLGLLINAMQHGMIFVSLGILPGANQPEGFTTNVGPDVNAHNRVGSSAGAMSTSFQINNGEAPGKGDLETAEHYGKRVAEITLRFERGGRAS